MPHDTDPATKDWAMPALVDVWNAIEGASERLCDCLVSPEGVPLDPDATWVLLEKLEAAATAVIRVTCEQWDREDPDLFLRTFLEVMREFGQRDDSAAA